MQASDPITTYFAPARAWLRSTWRSAGQLGYDPLPSAGADLAGPSQGLQSPEGSGQSDSTPSGAWAWLERTWRSAMALGFETLPVAAEAGKDEDLDAAGAPAAPMASPRAGYSQALQAAGGAVVLDARPGDGVGSGPGTLRDGAFARWHRPGRLFAGWLDPASDPTDGLDPERMAAAALAADVAEHGLPAPSSAWACIRAWLHRVLDPSPAAYPGQGDEDPADGLHEDGAPEERAAEAHNFPALLHEARARLAAAEAAVDAGRAQDVSSPRYMEAHDLPSLVAAARERLADAEAAVAAAEAAAGQGIDRLSDPNPDAFAHWRDAALAVVDRELEARAAGGTAAARSRPRAVSASRGPNPVRLLIRLPAAAQAAGLPEQGDAAPDVNPAGQTLSQALDSALAAARASSSQPGLESPVGHVTLRLRLRGGGLSVPLVQVAQTRVKVVPGVADTGAPLMLPGHGPEANASVSGTA